MRKPKKKVSKLQLPRRAKKKKKKKRKKKLAPLAARLARREVWGTVTMVYEAVDRINDLHDEIEAAIVKLNEQAKTKADHDRGLRVIRAAVTDLTNSISELQTDASELRWSIPSGPR
jgi:chromosome segregation ATPase